MLEKKCPYFYEWDEIMGSRHNITPPVLMEPGRTVLSVEGVSQVLEQDCASDGRQPDGTATETARGSLLGVPDANEAPPPPKQITPTKPPTPAKRPYSSVHPSSLHDAIMYIHKEKAEAREKRRKEEKEDADERLTLQRLLLDLQRQELRLREKQMDQQFELQRMQLELERERLKQVQQN